MKLLFVWKCLRLSLLFVPSLVAGEVGAFSSLSNPMPLTDPSRPSLNVTSDAPPALLVVVDSLGRRAGVDLAKAVTSYGDGTAFSEIPESIVDPLSNTRETGPDAGKPDPRTSWLVDLYTVSTQAYKVELHGLQAAATSIIYKGWKPAVNGRKRFLHTDTLHIACFVRPNTITKFQITFDPGNLTVSVERLLEPQELGQDIETACALNLIQPQGICQSLQAKATEAEESYHRGNNKAAQGELNAFLGELSAQGSKHIKEPALTILREEAQALLNPVPTMSTPQGGGKAKQ